MANNGNLLKKEDRTPSQRRESAKRAGIASAESRRRKKELKELLEIALSVMDETGMTEAENITVSLIKEARGGNVKAYEVIRDTLGQKPVEKSQMKIDLPQFIDDLDE